jgi:hypothetical protein
MSKDGLAARCKACQRTYDKARLHLPNRVALRKAYAKTEYGKERQQAGQKAWAARNPEKRAAHIIVGNKLRYGKLTRLPCAVCADPRVHAHHDDYSRPLDVTWLCVPCHVERHKGASNG